MEDNTVLINLYFALKLLNGHVQEGQDDRNDSYNMLEPTVEMQGSDVYYEYCYYI